MEKSTEKIRSRLAGVMEVEDPFKEGKLLRPFLRMRVTIDISMPLATSFWLPRKEKGNTWGCVKYEN